MLAEHFLDPAASAVVELPAEGLGHSDEQVGQLCTQHVGARFAPQWGRSTLKLDHGRVNAGPRFGT
jgi:hypothetical protein